MVSGLACRLAMPVIQDKKFARVVRADNMQMASAQHLMPRGCGTAMRVGLCRDHTPDWIQSSTSCGLRWGGGPGVLCYGWNSVSWLGEDAGGVY
jgi:hypothetical protein